MMGFKLSFRLHALKSMFERSISVDEVRDVVDNGEVIKEYADDQPYLSRLILGWIEKRPLHIVAADNDADEETIIITAYEPNPTVWEDDFKRKRK